MMLDGERSDENIILNLKKDPMLKDLTSPIIEETEPVRKKFSRSAVRAKVVEQTLKERAPCPVCGARLPPYCRSKDHAKKLEDGGMGNVENLDFTHPYCNSAKDAIIARREVLESKLNALSNPAIATQQ
jgi:DNA repair exonuclease SbcCD ATPase subunit